MYFNNKSRNYVESWVTTALILAQDELWSFGETLRLDLVGFSHMSVAQICKAKLKSRNQGLSQDMRIEKCF